MDFSFFGRLWFCLGSVMSSAFKKWSVSSILLVLVDSEMSVKHECIIFHFFQVCQLKNLNCSRWLLVGFTFISFLVWRMCPILLHCMVPSWELSFPTGDSDASASSPVAIVISPASPEKPPRSRQGFVCWSFAHQYRHTAWAGSGAPDSLDIHCPSLQHPPPPHQPSNWQFFH